jgi:hypothetical protein
MASALKAAAANRPGLSSSEAGEIIAQTGVYDLAAALVINDTIDMCKLPAGMVVDDMIIDTDDLDSHATAAVVFDVGIHDPDYAQYGGSDTSDVDVFMSGATTAQAGGLARMTLRTGRHLAPVDYDRYIRIKFTTAPATSATTGTIKLTAFTRNKGFDD